LKIFPATGRELASWRKLRYHFGRVKKIEKSVCEEVECGIGAFCSDDSADIAEDICGHEAGIGVKAYRADFFTMALLPRLRTSAAMPAGYTTDRR
jgi:hypothetical protein